MKIIFMWNVTPCFCFWINLLETPAASYFIINSLELPEASDFIINSLEQPHILHTHLSEATCSNRLEHKGEVAVSCGMLVPVYRTERFHISETVMSILIGGLLWFSQSLWANAGLWHRTALDRFFHNLCSSIRELNPEYARDGSISGRGKRIVFF